MTLHLQCSGFAYTLCKTRAVYIFVTSTIIKPASYCGSY